MLQGRLILGYKAGTISPNASNVRRPIKGEHVFKVSTACRPGLTLVMMMIMVMVI